MIYHRSLPKMSSILLMLLYLNTLYLTCCDASDPTILENYTNATDDADITETQHATCKIATEEIVASARATVTRVVSGACTTKIIDEKLKNLQKDLTKELKEIKSLLYSVLDTRKEFTRMPKAYGYFDEDKSNISSRRQPEIDNYNNTVQTISTTNGTTSIFFYYWQIKNFDEMLAGWKIARFQRSSSFYVGQNGYAMYIKITPRYFSDGTVFIGVGLTHGRQDAILKWPCPYKIRIEVLDYSSEQQRQDRRSPIWHPSTLCSKHFWSRPKLNGELDNSECVGLTISRQILFSKLSFPNEYTSRSTRYLWNGSITIKLTVYL